MVIEGVVRGSAQVAQVCNVTVGCVALENWLFISPCRKQEQLRDVNKSPRLWLLTSGLTISDSLSQYN